jgi:hypothetical protein
LLRWDVVDRFRQEYDPLGKRSEFVSTHWMLRRAKDLSSIVWPLNRSAAVYRGERAEWLAVLTDSLAGGPSGGGQPDLVLGPRLHVFAARFGPAFRDRVTDFAAFEVWRRAFVTVGIPAVRGMVCFGADDPASVQCRIFRL